MTKHSSLETSKPKEEQHTISEEPTVKVDTENLVWKLQEVQNNQLERRKTLLELDKKVKALTETISQEEQELNKLEKQALELLIKKLERM